MKKTLNFIVIALMAIPVLFTGCQKSEIVPDNSNANGGVSPVKSTITYSPIGTELIADLYDYWSPVVSYGTVRVGNDAANVYVTYELGAGYLIESTILYVGPPEGLPPGINAVIYPNGTGVYNMGQFPYQYSPGWPVIVENSHSICIPSADLPACFIVVALARVRDAAGNAILASAKAPTTLKNFGFYLNYCLQSSGSCETAYAFGNTVANCYIGIPGVTSNNWGWSNGPIGAGTYNWPIYAGAGQCNTANGTLVGTLNVVYTPPTATIKYIMGGSCHLSATHLYVGNLILPKKNGKFTTAPGQFPYKHEGLMGVNHDTYTISGLSGNVYIAAHSEVCW